MNSLKNILFPLPAAALTAALVLSQSACSDSDVPLATYTLHFEHPESIDYVWIGRCEAVDGQEIEEECSGFTVILDESCKTNKCKLNIDKGTEINGKKFKSDDLLSIEVYYKCDQEDDWNSHFCGTLTSAPVRVLADGIELENTTEPRMGFLNKDGEEIYLETNAVGDSFVSRQALPLRNMDIEIKGQPRVIWNSEVRLLDETGYAYVDLTGADVDWGWASEIWDYELDVPSGHCGSLVPGMSFCEVGMSFTVSAGVNPGYRIPSDFRADGKPLTNMYYKINSDAFGEQNFESTQLNMSTVQGEVVTVTSSLKTPIPETLEGQTFTAAEAEASEYSEASDWWGEPQKVDISLKLSFEADRKVTFTWDGRTWKGTYDMASADDAYVTVIADASTEDDFQWVEFIFEYINETSEYILKSWYYWTDIEEFQDFYMKNYTIKLTKQ